MRTKPALRASDHSADELVCAKIVYDVIVLSQVSNKIYVYFTRIFILTAIVIILQRSRLPIYVRIVGIFLGVYVNYAFSLSF